jgi:hypothetical protein
MVQVFERAVTGASCYAGTRNEAPDAVNKILQLVDKL